MNESPVQGLSRKATRDVELRGVTVRRNDVVFPMVAAANRDPDAFPHPDVFDIARPDHRHLSFGKGIHFCLGAPLARLEAEIAFTTLLAGCPELALAVDPGALQWRHSRVLRALKGLPVTFRAPAGAHSSR